MSSNKEDGIIVILSSPSGAGKTTLVKILAEKRDFFISNPWETYQEILIQHLIQQGKSRRKSQNQ